MSMSKLSAVWLLWALLVSLSVRNEHTSTVVDAFVAPTRNGAAATMPGGARKQSYVSSENRPSALHAKPQRLDENVEGVVYVNDRCINCAACSNFAPNTFRRSDRDAAHVVYQQPANTEDIRDARAALAACPVAAIRVETLAEKRHRARTEAAKAQVEENWTAQDDELIQKMSLNPPKGKSGAVKEPVEKPFPRRFLEDVEDVYWTGYHNERSFGATPYLLRSTKSQLGLLTSSDDDEPDRDVWIMIDTPKYGSLAIEAVESLTGPEGPDYLFLSHVDDSADHGKWAERYSSLQRIFHAGDLGRHNWVGDKTLEQVEVLLPNNNNNKPSEGGGLTAYTLNGEQLPDDWLQSTSHQVVVLHTPGHSPGSITLYRRPSSDGKQPGILFTGDTYAWTTRGGGGMSGFPRYGNNLRTQAKTLEKFVRDQDDPHYLEWDLIAPGHGHPRDYRSVAEDERHKVQVEEMEQAKEQMTSYSRW